MIPHRLKGQRLLVDRAGGGGVTAAEARSFDNLNIGVRAVPLPDRVKARVGAAQPAGQVMADPDLGLRRRLGAEVRIERDQSLDLIQRPADIAR